MKIKTEFRNWSWQPVNPQLIGIRLLAAWSLKTLSFSILNELNVLTESGRWRGIFFSFPSQKFSLSHYFTPKRALFHYLNRKISVTDGHHSTTAIFFFFYGQSIHSLLFTTATFFCLQGALKRFRNCVPLLHPKRDQLEKYFLYFLWFYSYLVPEN